MPACEWHPERRATSKTPGGDWACDACAAVIVRNAWRQAERIRRGE